MKLPRRAFLHLAAGAAALPAMSHSMGASLSDAAGAHYRSVCAGGHNRRCRASDRTMAIGAIWPAVCGRKLAGRWRQYWY